MKHGPLEPLTQGNPKKNQQKFRILVFSCEFSTYDGVNCVTCKRSTDSQIIVIKILKHILKINMLYIATDLT